MAKLDDRQFEAVAGIARSGLCQGFFTERRLGELALRYRSPYGWDGTAISLTGLTEETFPDAQDTVERAILLHSVLLATTKPGSF